MRMESIIGISLLASVIFSGHVQYSNSSKTMSVDTKLFLVDGSVLNQRVIPVVTDFLDRGDAVGATELFRETASNENFQAALRSDRITAQYLAEESKALLEEKLKREMLDDSTGGIIKDPQAIRRRLTEQTLSRFLVFYGCVHTLNRTTNSILLNHGALADYLRAKSEWIDEMISHSNEFLWEASDMKPAIGGDAKLLTASEASTLLNAFQQIPAPTDKDLRNQYDTLEAILETAVHKPRYRILIWTI